MRKVLTEPMVDRRARCVPQLGLIYLNNPKVGCTTIKYSLWAAADSLTGVARDIKDIHRRGTGPFLRSLLQHSLFGTPELRALTWFSVVRNPFLRILSAYLNKVGKLNNVGQDFVRRFGLLPNVTQAELGFTDFLRLVECEPDELLNSHFAPQYRNLLLPFSSPAFVGRLEAIDELEHCLKGVKIVTQKGRSTGAMERLHEFYTDEATAIVVRKFSDDFRLFGYSTKLSECDTFLDPQWPRVKSDLLIGWLSGGEFPVEHLDAAQRIYRTVQIEGCVDRKLDLIRGNYKGDDNWKHLEVYAGIAEENDCGTLAHDIRERMVMLRDAHRDRIERKDILLPAGSAVPERLSRKVLSELRKDAGRRRRRTPEQQEAD